MVDTGTTSDNYPPSILPRIFPSFFPTLDTDLVRSSVFTISDHKLDPPKRPTTLPIRNSYSNQRLEKKHQDSCDVSCSFMSTLSCFKSRETSPDKHSSLYNKNNSSRTKTTSPKSNLDFSLFQDNKANNNTISPKNSSAYYVKTSPKLSPFGEFKSKDSPVSQYLLRNSQSPKQSAKNSPYSPIMDSPKQLISPRLTPFLFHNSPHNSPTSVGGSSCKNDLVSYPLNLFRDNVVPCCCKLCYSSDSCQCWTPSEHSRSSLAVGPYPHVSACDSTELVSDTQIPNATSLLNSPHSILARSDLFSESQHGGPSCSSSRLLGTQMSPNTSSYVNTNKQYLVSPKKNKIKFIKVSKAKPTISNPAKENKELGSVKRNSPTCTILDIRAKFEAADFAVIV